VWFAVPGLWASAVKPVMETHDLQSEKLRISVQRKKMLKVVNLFKSE
jgi:hypothetical protein